MRAIAEVLGIGKSTVADDLAVQNRTDEPSVLGVMDQQTVQNRTEVAGALSLLGQAAITPGQLAEAAKADLEPRGEAVAIETLLPLAREALCRGGWREHD